MPGKLEFSFNSNKISEIPLDKEVITIGRKEDNDICIENLAVSGHHAKLLTLFEDSFLEDLNSTNGTFVNGKAVQKHPLRNGDVIVVGKHELRFISESSTFEDNYSKTVFIRRNPAQIETATNDEPTQPVLAAVETASSDNEQQPSALERACLQILNGNNAGKQLALEKPSLKFGRSGSHIIQINRRPDGHFIICLDKPDEASSIKVNGEDVGARSVKLQNHDVIEINKLKIEYYLGA